MKGKHVKSENIIKKIVCMVVVFMMMTSNLMTPVTILASDLNESEIEQTSSVNDGNNADENVDTGSNDSENEDKSSNKDLESDSKEQSNADEELNNQNSEDGNVSDNSESTQSNSNEESKADESEENTTTSNANQTDNSVAQENRLMLKNASLANTSSVNSETTPATPKELDDAMKATTKEDIEELKQNNKYNTRNDDYEIRTFETQFLSGASKDENGKLVWTATNSVKGHEFTFRVNYALSGYGELPAGAVQITIPKQILRNRDGNLDDFYIMSLPTLKECEEEGEMAELIYKEDGDYLVIYNPQEVEAGLNGYFEISYATNSATYNYKDYDTTNTDLVKNGGTASDDFYAIIALNVEKDSQKETLNNITEDKNVYINTTATLQSTQKRYPTIYREWNSSWMQTTPADANDYYYLVWEIRSYIDNTTQKYNFTLEDFVTDLTDGTSEGDYELVGYKLAGERYYSDKYTQENQTISGYRYDYVLTRHKKSVYAGKTYKLKNTVTATVDPIDQVDSDTNATSSNTFNWDPHFDPPVGHFNLFKYGNNNWYKRFNYHWNYANYDLDKLQDYENTGVNELKGFKYFTETIGYAYPWTLKEGGSSENPGDYGYNNVNYETWDDTLYLEGDETPMNTNDYYLEYFTYNVENQDVEFDDFYNKFNTKSATYEADEIITFYAKFGDRNAEDGNSWVQIGTYNLNTKELTPNRDYIAEMTTSKIAFKEGAHSTGWKYTTSNKHYYTYITVTPHFVLTNSNYIKGKVADKSSIKIENDVSTNITDHNGDTIFSKTDKAFDYARVTYYDSDITKTVASVSNKVTKKKYTITWKVNSWENATSGEGVAEYIKQDSGKFYDLIPLGGEIDTKTIQVQTEKGFLPENEYSYEVISDYKKSGRSMLIVTINAQADYYKVYYTTSHSWESMKDFGKNVLNPVAYETGNEKITYGYADNGGNLSLLNKVLMNDLDKTTDDKKFVYAEQTYNINALTASISGLNKKVKNSKDEEYSYSTEVDAGETYTYKIRFENTFMNSAKNLVFFDSLENFKVIDSEAGIEKTSGWHGTLASIDLTQLKQKGIDAKVYISTLENIDLESHNDLTNNEIWILATEETDFSMAKAIAIDMTKNDEGEDFILDSGDSVTATLYMHAPEDSSEEIERNQYAYNNVYMKNTLIDELDQTVDYFIHQDYTTIKYIIVADIPFQKVNAKDENEGIKGITFRLKGVSIYGNEIDENITSSNDGYITFKRIEAGEYILQEYEGTPDWIEDHTEHIVVINRDKSVYIDDQLISKETTFKITNEPRAHADVTIYKRDLVNKTKAVEGAKFKLSGTSDYGNEILMYGVSGADGKVTFENIEKGKYNLIEISTAEGYILNETNKEDFKVVVDENENVDILKKEGTKKIATVYAHTINFNDDGTKNSNSSYFGTDVNRTVKIEGAKSLHVELKYGSHTGWIAVYDGKTVPNNENYSQSVTGKLEGYAQNSLLYLEKEFDVEGDTAQFYFNTNNSTSGPYGYYAIITAYGDDFVSIYDNGNYAIYNEPLHSISFTKKDSIDKNRTIEGAKFKLEGTSDYGTDIQLYSTSNSEGIVTFYGLEKGRYTLVEELAANGYALNDVAYTVKVDELGNYDIGTVSYMDEIRYAHTINFDDEGNRNSNNYYFGTDVNRTVKIEGAKSLHVELKYGSHTGWIAVYDGRIVPNNENYGQSVSGKLEGYAQNGLNYYEKEFDVEGDTVQFYFNTNNNSNGPYGYYAVVTCKQENIESIYENGEFAIYNAPLVNFYFEKRDQYNNTKIGGAKFKLYGSSDIGNLYNEIQTSVNGTGIVAFNNLEPGTYVLKEIEPANTSEVSYLPDNEARIVEVFDDGKVTLNDEVIWPLSERNDEPYIWYNTRYKGEITVTKKWNDNLNNDSRQEPRINISTERGYEAYSTVYFRTADSTHSIIDYVTGGNVTSFKRNINLSEQQVLEKLGVTRLDNNYDKDNCKFKIYGWVEEETLYWWTNADKAILPSNLNYYFYNETSLNDINWSGIYKNGYWTGTAGEETITESTTSMKKMLYNCWNIRYLDMEWFNNLAINNKTDMEGIFGDNYDTQEGTMSELRFIKIGDNFKLFDTSILPAGNWKNQQTDIITDSFDLNGKITAGTYERIQPEGQIGYAVQIYGIQQDEDINNNKLGLTFGPALGADYRNSYVTHTYEANSNGTYNVVILTHQVKSDGSETINREYLVNSSGNKVTRTEAEKNKYNINIHNMTWQQIADLSISDPTVFRDCMLCGDTKKVKIDLNEEIELNVTPTYGDGVSGLQAEIKEEYKIWNYERNNGKSYNGYAGSRIRATLIGENSDTNSRFAGTNILSESTCLYSCFDAELKNVIKAKKVKYSTGNVNSYSTNTVYDDIWLLSCRELCGTAEYSGYATEGIGSSGQAYKIFTDTQSKFYTGNYVNSTKDGRKIYVYYGINNHIWLGVWLRSIYLPSNNQTCALSPEGDMSGGFANSISGIAPGFCLK